MIMMSYPYEIDFENIYLFTMKTVTKQLAISICKYLLSE